MKEEEISAQSNEREIKELISVCPYCHTEGVKQKRINPGKGYIAIGKNLWRCPICDSEIKV